MLLLQFEDIEEVERFMKIFQTANNGGVGICDAEFDNFSNGLAILNDNVKHLENEFTQLMKDFERKGKGLHLAHKYIMELQEDMKKVLSNTQELTIMCEKNHDDLLLLKDPQHNEKVQVILDKIHTNKNEVKSKKVKNTPKDKFTVSPEMQILFNDVKIDETGHITHTTKQGQRYDLKVSLPCLLYLNEIKNDITFEKFNKLYKSIGSNYAYLSKVIYNLRVGTFDEIMSKFCEKSKNITVRIRKDNTLIINDNLTGLKANDAYELLLSIQSKGNRKLFSQIRQAYKGFKHLNIDEFLFYSLCINYNNSRILNVLKPEEKETPVVNDPRKRKSLGMM